jgi:LacI family transcriptional regulator, galactose operon repressor
VAATIADVANRAGVSTATVSRVLAGLGGARADTRQRVLRSARELGYRPSGVARSLKLRTTRTLGLIITDIGNPFFPELVSAVEDAARERDYGVLLCNSGEDAEREAAYLELLAERRVDGVVIASSGVGRRHRAWLAKAPLPVVLVNCASPDVPLPTILSDNRAGAALAIAHLVALGHDRIGHITAPSRNEAAAERLEGARAALRAAGRDPTALVVAEGDGHVSGGATAGEQLLEADRGLTAIFAYNDLTAIGAIRAVRSHGLRVPDDVSVVGFDDIDLAAFADPPLTTVAQATASMGRWAVAELLNRLRGGSAATETVTLPVHLEIRSSTAPARSREVAAT